MIPGLERSPGEGIVSPFQYSWASLVPQIVKDPPAMRETSVRFLDWEDPLEEGIATHSSILAFRNPRTKDVTEQLNTAQHSEAESFFFFFSFFSFVFISWRLITSLLVGFFKGCAVFTKILVNQLVC